MQEELFVTCVICRCVYSLFRIYSLGTGRSVLPPYSLSSVGLLGTDSINVPGIVQDVPLHKRFPSWCWPVIFFLVVNIMWRCGVPHNMLCLRGPKVSCVSAHPHSQAVVFNTQSCFHWWCELKKMHQVLFEYFKCKEILYWDTSTWVQRQTTEQHQKTETKKRD